MLKTIVNVLKYIARVCVAVIHVIVGKKHGDCTCECADDLAEEKSDEYLEE